MTIKFFTIRSMNSLFRGGCIHKLQSLEGITLYGIVDPDKDHVTIESGWGVENIIPKPWSKFQGSYLDYGYHFIDTIDYEELLNISYIDPDWYEYHR